MLLIGQNKPDIKNLRQKQSRYCREKQQYYATSLFQDCNDARKRGIAALHKLYLSVKEHVIHAGMTQFWGILKAGVVLELFERCTTESVHMLHVIVTISMTQVKIKVSKRFAPARLLRGRFRTHQIHNCRAVINKLKFDSQQVNTQASDCPDEFR
jgi:hypothetical protein